MIYVDFIWLICWDASLESIPLREFSVIWGGMFIREGGILLHLENPRRVLNPKIGTMESKHCLKPILTNIGYSGCLRTKTSMNLHDVWKIVFRGTSVP